MKYLPVFITLLLISILLASCGLLRNPDLELSEVDAGMTGSIRGVDVVDANTVWFSGSGGEFATTADGGKTWFSSRVPGAESLDFRDVHGFSAQTALLMSAGSGDLSRIYRTTDGGRSWELCFTNSEPSGFFDGFDFLDENFGILFSDPIDTKLNLLFTRDGGLSWSRFHPELVPELIDGEYAFAASGSSIQFDPAGGIWIVTGGSVSRIWYTSGLGKEWSLFNSPSIQGDPAAGLFSIAPRSAVRVVAVGGNYQKTESAGANVIRQERAGEVSWQIPEGSKEVPFMECVKWMNASSLISCGPPGVWFSADYGLNWRVVDSQGFHTLDVCEKSGVVWLGGDRGKVSKISWK